MNKKTTSLLLASTLFLSVQFNSFASQTDSAAPYQIAAVDVDNLVDVSPSHWAYEAVRFVVEELEIMAPKTPTRFAGNDLATRYEVARAFYNATKRLETVTGRDLRVATDKADVTLDDVAAADRAVVNSVVNEYGIMQAMPGNKFMGEEKISRYELAFEINNYLRLLETKLGNINVPPANRFSQLTDIREEHWATPAVRNVVDEWGLMVGYPDNTFRGYQTLTRYELAAVLREFMNLIDRYLVDVTATPAPTATPRPTAVPTARPTAMATPIPVATEVPLSTFDVRAGGSLRTAQISPTNSNLEMLYGPFGDVDLWFGRLGIGIDGDYIIYGPQFQNAVGIPGLARAEVGGGLNWRMIGDSAEDFQARLGLGWEYMSWMGTGYQYQNHGPRGELALELPLGSWFGLFAEDRFTYFPFANPRFINDTQWRNEFYGGITIPAWTGFSVQLGYVDHRYMIQGNPLMFGDIGGQANIRLRF